MCSPRCHDATDGIALAVGEAEVALNDLSVSLAELDGQTGGLDSRLTVAAESFETTVLSIRDLVAAGELSLAQAEATVLTW